MLFAGCTKLPMWSSSGILSRYCLIYLEQVQATAAMHNVMQPINFSFLSNVTCSLSILLNISTQYAGKVSCVKFGADAKYMAVGSMDRNLRIFGLPGDESEEPKSPDH